MDNENKKTFLPKLESSNFEKETYEKIFDWGFSIADADFVSIICPEYGKLVLSIIDWQEKKIEITFVDVLAFNFQHIPYKYIQQSNNKIAECDYGNDSIYKVNNSFWLKEQIELFKENDPQAIVNDENHYKLCFNFMEQELNIICSKNVIVKYLE